MNIPEVTGPDSARELRVYLEGLERRVKDLEIVVLLAAPNNNDKLLKENMGLKFQLRGTLEVLQEQERPWEDRVRDAESILLRDP